MVVGDELAQRRDLVAVIRNQSGAARREPAAGLRPDRRPALRGDVLGPVGDGPAVREFVGAHLLDVLGVVRQQLLVAQHRVVRAPADDVVLGPLGDVGVDVRLLRPDRRERAVAGRGEAGEVVGRQLFFRGGRQGVIKEVRCAPELVRADRSLQAARFGDERLGRRDVGGSGAQARGDVVPGGNDVGGGRA